MSRNLSSDIDVYIDHFKNTVKRLREYEFNQKDRVLKKNILVSVIDALSRSTSNGQGNNRKRFTGIIEQFANWPNHTRVSAPHISYFLGNLHEQKYETAKEFIAQTMRNNSDGRLVTLASDPELNEIERLWPVQPEQKLVGQLSLTSFTHLNLLYQYRNSLVHELREPGYGMEFNKIDDEPFYHTMSSIDSENSTGQQSLELVYPLNFYFRITDSVIINLEKYFRKNEIDPYSYYKFGSSWIGELNT